MTTAWNARRLQDVLRRFFAGQQVIVVSNREPCMHELAADGSIFQRQPISGLVTALDPVLRAARGTWIAHGSGSADRAVVDRSDRVRIDGDDGYTIRRLWLSRGEERGHYHGLSNSALWPVCHLAFESPRFTKSDWRHYQEVNRRFADAVVAEATSPRPLVLVQDYHLALVPGLLRQRLADATIVAFWHIPWPATARLLRLPCASAIVEGLLGSDIVGFQTPEHASNFLDTVENFPESAVDRVNGLVGRAHGTVAVRDYPISVEWPSRFAESTAPVAECRRDVRCELGIEPDAPMMVAVDRLDYTKGIEERLAAIRRLLSRGNATVARPVFVQVAAPSRTRLQPYRLLGERVRALVASINERFATGDYRPVILHERDIEPRDIFRLFRAADACHVNSLDDGMNLVAKEFVAARNDDAGVLLLSRFTGAARELSGAIAVNPFDLDGVADAIADALTLPAEEQARRMRAMRRHVAEHNVFRWASRILSDVVAIRNAEADVSVACG